MRGLGYDSASTMSGQFQGWAAVVWQKCIQAVYVGCTSQMCIRDRNYIASAIMIFSVS